MNPRRKRRNDIKSDMKEIDKLVNYVNGRNPEIEKKKKEKNLAKKLRRQDKKSKEITKKKVEKAEPEIEIKQDNLVENNDVISVTITLKGSYIDVGKIIPIVLKEAAHMTPIIQVQKDDQTYNSGQNVEKTNDVKKNSSVSANKNEEKKKENKTLDNKLRQKSDIKMMENGTLKNSKSESKMTTKNKSKESNSQLNSENCALGQCKMSRGEGSGIESTITICPNGKLLIRRKNPKITAKVFNNKTDAEIPLSSYNFVNKNVSEANIGESKDVKDILKDLKDISIVKINKKK